MFRPAFLQCSQYRSNLIGLPGTVPMPQHCRAVRSLDLDPVSRRVRPIPFDGLTYFGVTRNSPPELPSKRTQPPMVDDEPSRIAAARFFDEPKREVDDDHSTFTSGRPLC